MPEKARGKPLAATKSLNYLIGGLPKRQRDAVLAQCDSVDLALGAVLCEAGEPLEYAYFPLSGSISLVESISGHEPFQTESIGSEGMLGLPLVLGVNRGSQRGIVQTPCVALRLTSRRMRTLLAEQPDFLRVLQRYLYVVLADLSQTAGCVRFHDVSRRLARGLLLAHDRVQADNLPLLTHKLLADMLGVQRGSVTIAAASLQKAGVIRYSRGKIAILDRKALEAASCECYRTRVDHYASLLS